MDVMEEIALKRAKKKARFKRRLITLIIVVLLVVFALKAPLFNVKSFTVTGNNYYTAEEIRTMGGCKTGSNIFIGTSRKEIKQRLSKDSYVKGVKVKTHLPSTLEIVIDERVQLAGLTYGETYIVIDNEGIVLRKTAVDPKITIIRGVNITKLEIGEALEVDDPVLLRQALEILDTMSRHNMYFKTVDVSGNEVKAYVLDNLLVKGTKDDLIAALKAKTIQLDVQALFDRKIEHGTIIIAGTTTAFSPDIK